jgi:hypothetical protein
MLPPISPEFSYLANAIPFLLTMRMLLFKSISTTESGDAPTRVRVTVESETLRFSPFDLWYFS